MTKQGTPDDNQPINQKKTHQGTTMTTRPELQLPNHDNTRHRSTE